MIPAARKSSIEPPLHYPSAAELIPLAQFNYIRGLAMQHAGIALADYKRNMVHRRISKRLSVLGLDSIEAYCALLAGAQGEREMQPLINALTTNKTHFFREQHHFDHLATTAWPRLQSLKAANGERRLRVWSAGCSSGQEPFSIAMTLSNCIHDLPLWNARILGTDIDTEILQQAREALYDADQIATIPSGFRAKSVEPVSAAPGRFRMAPSLRSLIAFKPLNLHGSWPMTGQFDIIFCRNVVIYFDKPTQCRLFDRFADLLHDGGILYIGHSESLYRVTERFRPIGQNIYEKIN